MALNGYATVTCNSRMTYTRGYSTLFFHKILTHPSLTCLRLLPYKFITMTSDQYFD